jgi:hypothetical protein
LEVPMVGRDDELAQARAALVAASGTDDADCRGRDSMIGRPVI